MDAYLRNRSMFCCVISAANLRTSNVGKDSTFTAPPPSKELSSEDVGTRPVAASKDCASNCLLALSPIGRMPPMMSSASRSIPRSSALNVPLSVPTLPVMADHAWLISALVLLV